MKDSQKYTRSLTLGALILSGSLLQACGGDPDYDYDDRYYNDYYQNSAGCQVPAGIKERTVVGNFGVGGATLKLDLYSQSGNTIAAYGELSVPSVEALFGVNVFNGNPAANPLIGNGYTGNNSQFRTCVSSNGFSGTLQDGTYEHVNMALVGNGNTFISMGTTVGVAAFISGNDLQGTVLMRVGSYPDQEFILAK